MLPEFQSQLYQRIIDRVAPSIDSIKALSKISERLQQQRLKGKLRAEGYDDPRFRRAYMITSYPVSIAQARHALQLTFRRPIPEVRGDARRSLQPVPDGVPLNEIQLRLRELSPQQNKRGGSQLPIRVTIIGGAAAPEIVALGSLVRHDTAGVQVLVADVHPEKWSKALEFTLSLLDAPGCRPAARTKVPFTAETLPCDLGQELHDQEVERLAKRSHLIIVQNVLGEVPDSAVLARNIVKVANAMPQSSSLLISESTQYSSTQRAIRALEHELQGIAAEFDIDNRSFTSKSESATRVLNPFAIPEVLLEWYFGKFENGNSQATRRVRYTAYELRHKQSRAPRGFFKTADFDTD